MNAFILNAQRKIYLLAAPLFQFSRCKKCWLELSLSGDIHLMQENKHNFSEYDVDKVEL
jgi:hypothetical protein